MATITLKPVQVATIVNDSAKNMFGENAVLVSDDLSSGIIDLGVSVANANAYSNWLDGLLVATAKYIFSYRPYKAQAPNILRDNFEFGLLVQKIKQKLPKAKENSSFKLVNNTSYDDNVFVENEVIAKIFKEQATFEIQKSITIEQIKTSFEGAEQLNTFVSQTFGLVANALELYMQQLTKLCINNMMGETIVNNTGNDANVRVIKLLTNYKSEVDPSSTLTSANCIFNREFLRYATSVIKEYSSLLTNYNTKFNIEHLETFTPKDLQHIVLLEKFSANVGSYLESSVFHDEFVKLPYHETIPYWQGIGSNSLADKSTIKITTASGNAVNQSYIIGTIFDHDALGIGQNKEKTTTHEVKSSDFVNYWYKRLFRYFNDLGEQMVIFTLE